MKALKDILIIVAMGLIIALSVIYSEAGEKENLYKRAGVLEERMQKLQEQAVVAQTELQQVYQAIQRIEMMEKGEKDKKAPESK